MPFYVVDRHTVFRSPGVSFSSYMPGLAVSIAARFDFKPGEQFFADLAGMMSQDLGAFPPDISVAARKMRIDRMLVAPVQVDDLIISMTTDEHVDVYQKTKRVIVTQGVLEAPPGPIDSTLVTSYIDPRVARADVADPVAMASVQALEAVHLSFRTYVLKRLGAVEDVLLTEGIPVEALTTIQTKRFLQAENKLLGEQIARLRLDIETLKNQVNMILEIAES